MRSENSDMPTEKQAPPCVVCGRPSGCAAWGFRLCYGEAGRMGCVTRLYDVMPYGTPFDGQEAFAEAWVAANRRKVGAA